MMRGATRNSSKVSTPVAINTAATQPPEVRTLEDLVGLTLSELQAVLIERKQAPAQTQKAAFRQLSELMGFVSKSAAADKGGQPAAAAPASVPEGFCSPSAPAADDSKSALTAMATAMAAMQTQMAEIVAKFDKLADVQAQVASLQQQNTALNLTISELHTQVHKLETSVHSADDAAATAATDAADVESRKCKLRLTRLPAEVQTQADAATFVGQLFSALEVQSPPSVTLYKPSFSEVAASNSTARTNKGGSIVLSCASVQDKITALKARGKLGNTSFTVGIDEDLIK